MLFFLVPYAAPLVSLFLNIGLYPYAEPSARLVLENVLILPEGKEDTIGGDADIEIMAFVVSGIRLAK